MLDIYTRRFVALALLLAVGATSSLAQSQAPSRMLQAPAQNRVQASAPGTLPSTSKSAQIDTTLNYNNFLNGAFFIDIGQFPDPGDSRAVGLFFEAPFDGTVDGVGFSILNGGGTPGIQGSGTLRIKMVPAGDILTPETAGVDSLDLDFSQLRAENGFPNTNTYVNQIDLTSRNFQMFEGVEYFFQFSLVNESSNAALSFAFDGGVEDTTQTSHYPARTFVWVEDIPPRDEYVSLIDPVDPDFRNLNVVAELQLSRPPPPQMTQLQLFHNAAGAGEVDMYLGDTRIADDLAFQEATSFQLVRAGAGSLAIVAGSDPNRNNPIATAAVTLDANSNLFGMVFGRAGENFGVAIEELANISESREQRSVYVAHGGLDAGMVDLNILDESTDHNVVETLFDDLALGEIASTTVSNQTEFNLEVATADGTTQLDVFRVNLISEGSGTDGGGDASKGITLLALTGIAGGTPSLSTIIINADGTVSTQDLVTDTQAPDAIPSRFALRGNYPNPFNPTTTIAFDLSTTGYTTLRVYNLLGQEVATLVEGVLPASSYEVRFDAATLPSGAYLYRLASGTHVQQKMLMLVK